jgi:hypothetical protein
MYFRNYGKFFKLSATQIIFAKQKEFKNRAGRKETRFCHNRRKQKIID